MKLSVILGSILIVCFTFSAVESWSGNVCTKTVAYYYSQRYCNWWCWSYKYRTKVNYKMETSCCPGYTHNGDQVCNIPICSPSCLNGGECVRPNECNCPDGFNGPICNGIV